MVPAPDSFRALEAELLPLLATGATKAEAVGMLAAALGTAWVQPWYQRRVRTFTSPEGVLEHLGQIAKAAPATANAWFGAWLLERNPYDDILNVSGLRWLTSLPDGLVVQGAFRAGNTGLQELPSGLKVGYALTLWDTPLRTVPADLVAKSLNLSGSDIETLPRGLAFEESLNLERTVHIQTLPEGLTIGTHLELQGSRIERLPQGLVVGSLLDLRGCHHWDGQIPLDAQIGSLRTDRHPNAREPGTCVGITLEEWRMLHPQGEKEGR
jgi:hypothetical protein